MPDQIHSFSCALLSSQVVRQMPEISCRLRDQLSAIKTRLAAALLLRSKPDCKAHLPTNASLLHTYPQLPPADLTHLSQQETVPYLLPLLYGNPHC
jgi:hypothetical protein